MYHESLNFVIEKDVHFPAAMLSLSRAGMFRRALARFPHLPSWLVLCLAYFEALHRFELFQQRVHNCVEDEGREGFALLDTSLYWDPDLRSAELNYRGRAFVMDSRMPGGSPRRPCAASMGLRVIVSKAFVMSSSMAVSQLRPLADRIISFKTRTLLKQPFSCTKPFCLAEKEISSPSLESTMPQYYEIRAS